MLRRILEEVLGRLRRPSRSRAPRGLKMSHRSFNVERLESRIDACALGLDWAAVLLGPSEVYASEYWAQSVGITHPDPACTIVAVEWTIPPRPYLFGGYIHNLTEGRVVDVDLSDPAADEIDFYWGPVNAGIVITARVTLDNGESRTATKGFVIAEPTFNGAQITVDTLHILDPGPTIELGTPGIEGFKYSADVTAPRPGNFFFIQLVWERGTAIQIDGTSCAINTGDWGLDSQQDDAHYEYPQPNWPTDENGVPINRPTLSDNPDADLFGHDENGTRVSSRTTTYEFLAQTWLMFEATDDDSAPIPVAKGTWKFNYTVELKLNPAGTDYLPGTEASHFQIIAGGPPNPSTATMSPIDEWPAWNRNARDYEWECG